VQQLCLTHPSNPGSWGAQPLDHSQLRGACLPSCDPAAQRTACQVGRAPPCLRQHEACASGTHDPAVTHQAHRQQTAAGCFRSSTHAPTTARRAPAPASPPSYPHSTAVQPSPLHAAPNSPRRPHHPAARTATHPAHHLTATSQPPSPPPPPPAGGPLDGRQLEVLQRPGPVRGLVKDSPGTHAGPPAGRQRRL
jgi:hypothetical protein